MGRSRLGNERRSKKITIGLVFIVLIMTFSFTKVHAATTVSRFNGTDRYETAAKVCDDGWQSNSDYAVIVNGENFPDALSAAPLAKKYNAPILLTQQDVLNTYTSAELNRLNVKNVFLIGGKGVISQSIEDALKARKIKVTRIGGADRYETDILVAQKLGKANEIALVNGDDFHDGLSVAPIAALKGMPIILTGQNYIPDSVKKYLQSNKNADQIYVIGGTNQIDDGIFSVVPNSKRIASGNGDAYSRNTSIINAFQSEISTGTLYIASGKDFPDALVASALAPYTSSPILYVNDSLPASTQNFLQTNIINNIKILGGVGSVSYDTQQIVSALPLSVSSADNITDTIWQNDKYTPRQTILVTASDSSIKEMPVTWSLTKVNTSRPGTYTINGKLNGTDQTVVTTLIVKPIPVQISDLTATSQNGSDFSLPTTVTAKMSDGSSTQVPVSWDYGTQQGNKTGISVFTGTVDHYNKKVKLTLTGSVPAQILSIPDLKLKLSSLSDFLYNPYYTKVAANMSDGSIQTETVTWNWSSMQAYSSSSYYIGVYQVSGTVSGYNGTVNAIIVTGDAPDPTPDEPFSPSISIGGTGSEINLPAMDVVQGDKYTLPTTVTNPDTGTQAKVTWTTLNIDPTIVDTGSVETSRVSEINFVGTISNSNRQFLISVNVRPKIMGIDPDSLKQTISRASYSTGDYDLPSTLSAVMQDGSTKSISVVWGTPIVSATDSNTLNVTGTVKWYNNPVTLVITLTN